MATTVAAGETFSSTALRSAEKTADVPWYLYVGIAGIFSSSLGGWWDAAWHASIGRDTFWTPPHVAIYLCGVLAGLTCGYLILAATFGRSSRMRAASVQVLGFRAPLGAFVAAWGGIAMLTAAPFDNWWHNAYGLDVQLITPPHSLIYLGMRGVTLGMLLLTSAAANRARESGADFRVLQRLLLFVGGLLLSDQMLLLTPYTYRYLLHNTHAYLDIAVMAFPVLVLVQQIAHHRWAATITAGLYTAAQLALLWVLPLFPAQPRLGPINTPVTHMVPPCFPLLVVCGAVAMDLVRQRRKHARVPMLALWSSLAFTSAFAAAEWPFANFLLSPASGNRIFGTQFFPYIVRAADRVPRFVDPVHGAAVWMGLFKAVLAGAVLGSIASLFGRWMQEVKR